MKRPSRASIVPALSLAALAACGSPPNRELVQRRESSLYGLSPSESRSVELPIAADPQGEPQCEDTERVPGDLASYLDIGLQASAALRAAFEDWVAATERIERASTLPDPKLIYGEFLESVQTRTGPQERRLGVSQAFPWPGRLGQEAAVAQRRADASWQRVQHVRLGVVKEIEVAFHEYAFLGRELEITGELLKLLRDLEPVVQGQVSAGRGQEDILRLQVEVGRLEDELASLERRRPALSARLAAAVHLPDQRDVLPIPRLDPPGAESFDAMLSYEQALTNNPELLELRERVEVGRESEVLASFRRKPSFSIGLDYFDTSPLAGSSVGGNGDDPLFLALSVSLPIWTASYAAAEREARHVQRASQGRLDAFRLDLRARIEEEAFRIDDARRKITLYRESLIPRATESLDLTLSAYRAAKAPILDLIDSERAKLEFELSFWRACRDYLQAAARLRAMTAGDLR